MVQFEIAAIYSAGPDQTDGNEAPSEGASCGGGRVKKRQETNAPQASERGPESPRF